MAQTTKTKEPTQAQIKKLIGGGQPIDINLVTFVQDLGEGQLYIDEDMCMDQSVMLSLKKNGQELGSCIVLSEIDAHIDSFFNLYSKRKTSKLLMRDVITELVHSHEQELQSKISGHAARLVYTHECSVSDSAITLNDMYARMNKEPVEEKEPIWNIEGLGLVLDNELCDILGIKHEEVFYEFGIRWTTLQQVFG